MNVTAEKLNTIGTLVIAGCTLIYTIGTFLLLWTNRNTIKLLKQQLRNQTAFNQSAAHHAVMNAHHDLFFEIIKDKDLRSIFARERGLGEEVVQRQFLATLMINHARRIFTDHYYNVSGNERMESFERDARDLFALPFIRGRWNEVRQYHPKPFADFVDKQILS